MTLTRHIEIFNDAGLLREYTAIKYGQSLTYGGSPGTYFAGMKLIRRLVRMTGQSIESVLIDVRNDYYVAEFWEA
ncbi:hypothetical protein LCGC14_2745760 [marine sediment metagenome]|uniref:Uncharacterized protein n=1 Tax=marine sediment metagenome TaxID=412755 RepID=A0A0F9BUV7_9ZZZZ